MLQTWDSNTLERIRGHSRTATPFPRGLVDGPEPQEVRPLLQAHQASHSTCSWVSPHPLRCGFPVCLWSQTLSPRAGRLPLLMSSPCLASRRCLRHGTGLR